MWHCRKTQALALIEQMPSKLDWLGGPRDRELGKKCAEVYDARSTSWRCRGEGREVSGSRPIQVKMHSVDVCHANVEQVTN